MILRYSITLDGETIARVSHQGNAYVMAKATAEDYTPEHVIEVRKGTQALHRISGRRGVPNFLQDAANLLSHYRTSLDDPGAHEPQSLDEIDRVIGLLVPT